ncbi:LysR family transcriptional regulator [Actinoplanes sp. N902-109]|uniref:LysR family transcriptional regulator n=1 Tax=Actinoplanes sp. (strain N902-109) TaxID=649831 RepID=UPI001E488EDC|nr:LysR family transcriptional regulator [Actinoplanes sp. N902-109]
MRQLETFRKVALLGSVTRAAGELRYAPSTVTAQIKTLEGEFGVALFERSGRGTRLTAAGERLLPYADKMLDLLAEARHTLRPESEPSGLLVVGTMESITSYRLPPLLELLHHRFPRLRLSMRPTSCQETQAALRHGTFDVGFLMQEEVSHPGLQSLVLCEEPLTLVAAPDDPIAAEPAIDLDRLRATKILGTEPGCVYRDRFIELLSGDSPEPFPVLEMGTIEAIKRSVEVRLGVALLPRIAVAGELAAGTMVELPWEVPFRIYTQVAWNENKWMSPELRTFVDEVARVLREEATAGR